MDLQQELLSKHVGLPESIQVYRVTQIPTRFETGTVFTFGDIKSTEYTHGMHVYPAKFVPQIPRWAFRYAAVAQGKVVLDPFCGSGTTLVEARISGLNSYGIDMDPLARLLSRVKSTPLYMERPEFLYQAAQNLLGQIKKDRSKVKLDSQSDVNLHYNWKFWFSIETMQELIRIKRNIRSFEPPAISTESDWEQISEFFLCCLSSIIKRVSYLADEQIKVRLSHEKLKKGVPKPLFAFRQALNKHVPNMIRFTQMCSRFTTFANVIGEDARKIPLENKSVDLIVTSPPYLNAMDYPFAHKHNLFILDLLKPGQYRPHSRRYIGVSERVLLKKMFDAKHSCGDPVIDQYIDRIYSGGSDVDKNRAYIVWEYFTDMKSVLAECFRVLESGSHMVIFVGDNRIRKQYVPTHEILNHIASQTGFEVETFFYHQMKNKILGVGRNVTGGEIQREMATVLRKP